MNTTANPIRFSITITLLLNIACGFGSIALAEIPLQVSQPDLARHIDQPTISQIYRDRNDLLWIGTQHGLYRFDGVRLTHFNSKTDNSNYISHSDIRGITTDKSGTLLLATFGGGILKWNIVNQRFEKLPVLNDLDMTALDFLSTTEDGSVWLASKGSLVALDEFLTNIVFWSQHHSEIENFQKINGVKQIDEHIYLIAANSGLWKIDTLDRNSFSKIELSNDPSVLAIESSTDGSIVVALADGNVARLDPTTLKVKSSKPAFKGSASTVSDISIKENLIWMATDRGIYILNMDLEVTKVLDESNTGLSENYITSLHFDDDTYWVGTIHGLNILTKNHLELYNKRQHGIHHEVLSFASSGEANLWVGTYDGLFSAEAGNDSDLRKWSNSKEKLKDQRIMTLATRENELWIGFRADGVQVLDTDTNQLSSLQTSLLDKAEVTKILSATDGTVWVATYNQGLYRVVNGVVSHVDSISSQSVTILLETDNGAIVAASESGFYILEDPNGSFREIDLIYPQSAETPLLLSLVEHPSGLLYLGTKDQGTFVWRDFSPGAATATLERFGTDPEVREATIYGMLLDDEGKLWASTQQGIVVLNPDQSLRFRLLKQDGLQDNDFNFGAAFKDSTGAMYFGGVRGYNRLDPPKLIIDYSPPEMHLVSLQLPDKEYYVAGRDGLSQLELNHDDYFVTFSFSTLDFTSTGASQYRYKLEGFDPQWIDNGSRKTATYTNLPPGTYTFRAEGANSAGVWSERGVSLGVRVKPPYWRTAWAYSFYAILLLLAISALKRIYDNHAIKERALKLAAKMMATADRAEDNLQEQQEVQDELVKASYRHNIALLELIRDVLDQSGPGVSGRGVSKHIEVLTLLEECYFYQTDSLQADMHRFTNVLISRLISSAGVPTENLNTVNAVTHQLIPAELASPLALVMFELLENSFSHAFSETSGVGNFIQVALAVSDPIGQQAPVYTLSVEDDGIGFPASLLTDPEKGAGLGYVRQIAERYHGKLEVSYEPGTRVTFTLGNCSQAQCSIE